MSYLEGVHVRWGWGGTEPASDYTFFHRNWNVNREIGTEFFVIMGIIPAEVCFEVIDNPKEITIIPA